MAESRGHDSIALFQEQSRRIAVLSAKVWTISERCASCRLLRVRPGRIPVCDPADDDESKLIVEPSPQGQPLRLALCLSRCKSMSPLDTLRHARYGVAEGWRAVLAADRCPAVLRLSLKYIPFRVGDRRWCHR